MSTVIRIAALAVLIIAFYAAYIFMNYKSGSGAGADADALWSLSGGDWYYDGDIRNAWLSDKYFIDEDGRMLTDEWIYISKADGACHHSKVITKDELNDIDLTRLSYVSEDGTKLKNKNIYSTPFSFDGNGYCSISIDDIKYSDNADYIIDGLRRYVVIDGRYKQSY